MGKKKVLMAFLILFIIAAMQAASAAVVSGTVYDALLNKRQNAIVEIDTKPVQRIVAAQGTYSFNVPKGSYTIKAAYSVGTVLYSKDSISIDITDDGEYTVDLILFPSTEEEDELLNETDLPIEDVGIEAPPYYLIFFFFLLVAVVYIIYRYRQQLHLAEAGEKKKEAADGDEAHKVLKFLKKEGGRSTQKEIRKNFPQSEAKISLVISDLEDQGKVRKIKKGRGNIIILQK
jgi:uncharacterized membrane protein